VQNNFLPANPLPISNPLLAGRESMAFASRASSLSNTGVPSPYKLCQQTKVMNWSTKIISNKYKNVAQTMVMSRKQIEVLFGLYWWNTPKST
jgi:hypothetical protein